MTQTLDQFVAARNGQHLDFDGVYGAQCVDLVLFCCRDVFNVPSLRGNAIDEFGEESDRFTWTRNNPADLKQIPPRGAVMVWGPNIKVGTGVFGHTAIVLSASAYSFDSFDQNWPVGAACHVVHHTYDGVIGWGVLKQSAPLPAPKPIPAPVVPPVPPVAPPVPPVPPVTPPIIPPAARYLLFNFNPQPPDPLHPVSQVTTFVDAVQQCNDYLAAHPECDHIALEAIISGSAHLSIAQLSDRNST